MFAGSMGDSEATNGCAVEDFDVTNVRQRWRENEDHVMAYKLQEEEFSDHYGLNRSERRRMHVDVNKTKEEQELEDKYAEEYWEQVRRDREQEDARIAADLEKQLMEEEERRREADRNVDEELARRLQKQEEKRKRHEEQKRFELADEDARIAQQIQEEYEENKRIENERRLEMTQGDSMVAQQFQQKYEKRKDRRESTKDDSLVARQMQQEFEQKNYRKQESTGDDSLLAQQMQETLDLGPPPPYDSTASHFTNQQPIELASGMTPEHRRVLDETAKEEDNWLAQYIQDRELANYYVQQNDGRISQEQRDNERNHAVDSQIPSGPDLISFDQPVARQRAPPPRPPPPKCKTQRQNSNNNSDVTSALRRPNLESMGAIRVLPPQ